MNYHLSRDGNNLGSFSLEQLQQWRASGGLTGKEYVWTEGMAQWQPLDTVVPPPPRAAAAAGQASEPTHKTLVISLAVGALAVFLIAFVWVTVHSVVRPAVKEFTKQLRTITPRVTEGRAAALEAASRPVVPGPNLLSPAEVNQRHRDFRLRQYAEGYQLRGEHAPAIDPLALGLISNWLALAYGGPVDTNLPSVTELCGRLAKDPACTDPVVLTVAGVNARELHVGIPILERALQGFEKSRHLGYPKFYAIVWLAQKLAEDHPDRLPNLDAQARHCLPALFKDGSLRPQDQEELGEILVFGWGESFFSRNAEAACAIVDRQGEDYRWLALVLKGQNEITQAWKARGGGYVNTVSKAGWRGFSHHLAAARQHLTAAWELDPRRPLAACRMMQVSLGDSDIREMREWFDHTVGLQIDYAQAWSEMRWGLRPRWHGDLQSMLAFGVTAVNTRRFDTDVPRKFFDSLADLEAESGVPAGQHLYGRADIWPHVVTMYEGYVDANAKTPRLQDGWRSTYAIVASLAGKYDVARQQLETLNWKPYPANLNAWERDLTLLPLEVAARTGSQSAAVAAAERRRQSGDLAGALKSYAELADAHNLDVRTLQFMRERQLSLGLEQRLQAGQWVPFLPADTNLTGWHVTYGKCSLEPDGSLEAAPEHYGHLLYSHARVGPNFEARGGVVVAAAAAKILELPLDTLIVRKIGHPVQREFAVGALAEGDVVLFDAAASGLNPLLRGQLDRIVAEEKQRLAAYRARFHPRGIPILAGRRVLLVDDGLATGATTEAAVLSARKQHARSVVVAAPVASAGAVERLERVADQVKVLFVDPHFEAVGRYYDVFSQTTDEEVSRLLEGRTH